MNGPDRIDAALAKHFAWSFARSGVVPDLEQRLRAARDPAAAAPLARDSVPAAPIDEGAAERTRERARRACAPLALAIESAWSTEDEGESARTTKRLLVRAERLDHVLAGLDARPVLAVRLLRLFVRHGAKWTPDQRERAAALATLLPLDDPEVAELLVEAARAGLREMATALLADEDWRPDVGDGRALGSRLAEVIEGGPTHASRVVAIDVLSLAGPAARAVAAPALRRALRVPSIAVRGHALHALVTAEPCPLVGADVVPLVRELTLHGIPEAVGDEEQEEDERLFADALLAAIGRVSPAESEEALLDLIDADHEALWLDAAWATEALAAAFPETAAAMVDHWLRCARTDHRMRALGALARLPDDLAEPRLTFAASDPAPALRDAARRQWLERFPRACPSGPADLVGADLLEGPPSDAFLSRLAVLQGRVRAARRSMARALLGEAPDREALVLLLQFVGDDADSREPTFAVGAAGEAWAATLVRRFGAAGVEGVCALAARYGEPDLFGWMRRLGDLVEQGIIAPKHARCVRDLAARQITSAEGGRVDDALRVLALLGAPSEAGDALLSLALGDDPAGPQARAIVVSWKGRELDERVVHEMRRALDGCDWARVERVAAVGLARRVRGGVGWARRVLEAAETEETAVDAAVVCARLLRERGALDDEWAARAIARPESPIFSVAVRAWWRSPVVRSGLEAAMGASARGYASAIEAAVALLHAEPGLSPRDRRLHRLLERSGPVGRAKLVGALCMHGVPEPRILPYLGDLVTSDDPVVTAELTGVAASIEGARARAILRASLPRVVDADLAADIEEALGRVEMYWEG
jgi:hypothetical protein